MKKVVFSLIAMGFVLMSPSMLAEEKKETPKKGGIWKELPQEAKDKLKAINKKVKDGDLTEEKGKKQKKAIFAEYKKSKTKK